MYLKSMCVRCRAYRKQNVFGTIHTMLLRKLL